MLVQAVGCNYFSDTGYPVTVKRVDSLPGKSHGFDLTEIKHFHNFTELVIVSSGAGVHWVEGIEHPVCAGDVFALKGDQQHYFMRRSGLVIYNVMFQQEALPLPHHELQSIPGYRAMFELEPEYRKQGGVGGHLRLHGPALVRVESLAAGMLEEIRQQAPGFQAALLAGLLDMLVHLSRQYPGAGPEARGYSILSLARVIGLMEEDVSRQWRLDQLSLAAGMPPGKLNRLFKLATGQSPIDYLIHLRLRKAMTLLLETDLPVTRIAFDTGFNDSNYFARAFRRAAGMPPSAFRRKEAGKGPRPWHS